MNFNVHLINLLKIVPICSQHLQLREEVANAFLNAYQLRPEEVKSLRGTRDGDLDASFFAALDRVKQIHSDCKVLLRTNQQTTG